MAYEIDTQELPFSEEKQKAIIGHLLFTRADVEFFINIVSKVDPGWFKDEMPKLLFKFIKNWYKNHSERPTEHQIMESLEMMEQPAKVQEQIRGVLSTTKVSRERYSIEGISTELQNWMKARIITMALPEAGKAFNNQEMDKCALILNGMVKDYYDANFHGDGVEKFTKYQDELAQEEMDRARALSFGLERMDRILDQHGAKGMGSLLRGDMTILLAPTNVGKTSAMVTVACANLRRGKSVLFITHEGAPREIKNKIMRCISRMNKPELSRGYHEEDKRKSLMKIEDSLDKLLTYMPMNKPGLSVEEVAAQIDKLQQARKAATGEYYDMIVDDYPAKLTTELARGGYFQLRHIHEEVYNQFVQMALKYDCHVLTAIQTNRDGSRVNKRTGMFKNETRLLQMEDVMEAWGPMTAASTVISLNRDWRDAANKKLTYLVCKSRSGDTGWAVIVNTDYDRCVLHSNELGCFWLRGEESVSQQSVSLMNIYRDQEITQEMLERLNGSAA